MVIVIPQPELSRIVSTAASCVQAKSPLPILGSLLLRAEDGYLHATGSDLVVTIKATSIAEVKQAGVCCVSASLLLDRVKNLPNADVTVKFAEEHLHLKCGNRSFKVATIQAADYPQLPAHNPETIPVECSVLARLFERVEHSISDDSGRPFVYCVALSSKAGVTEARSTDGHSGSVVSERTGLDFPDQVIPRDQAIAFTKWIGTKGEVRIEFKDGHMFAVRDDLSTIACKLADESVKPAAIGNVIDQAVKAKIVEVELDREELLDATKALTPNVSGLSKKAPIVSVKIANGVLHMSSVTEDGSSEDSVPCQSERGATTSFSVNGRLFAASLSAAETKRVTVKANELDPILIREVEGAQPAIWLVMPTRQ